MKRLPASFSEVREPTSASKARVRLKRRGSVAVEIGLIFPVLGLMAMGASDFSRLFTESMVVTSAANTGVLYGSVREDNWAKYAAMIDAAKTEVEILDDQSVSMTMTSTTYGITGEADGMEISAGQFCRCAGDPLVVKRECLDLNCGTERLHTYVRVTVTRDFNTMIRYPGVPHTVQMNRTAEFRVE